MKATDRYKYSAKHIRRMKLFERQFLKAVFVALYEQVKPVVAAIRSKGVQAAEEQMSPVAINAKLAPVIKDIYKTVGLYFANKTIHDLKQSEKKAGFGFNEEFIRDIRDFFNRFLLNQAILPISETTREQILAIISEGTEKGWGAEKIASMLESPELLLWRARMIVRTESNKAMNYGQRLGESKSEFESTKTWIAANDHRTRHSHRVVDDMQMDFREKYLVPIYKGKIQMQVGVDLMDGPGDPRASAGNVINCRCTLAFRNKRDANGRLIKKQSTFVLPVKEVEKEIDYELKNIEVMDNAKLTAVLETSGDVLKRVVQFEEKINTFEPTFTTEVKTELQQTRQHIEGLVNEKSLKDSDSIDKLIGLINSKEYNPEIKLETDNPEVIAQINLMKAELVVMLKAMREQLGAKKKYRHKIKRDKNELMDEIISEEI